MNKLYSNSILAQVKNLFQTLLKALILRIRFQYTR